MSRSEQTVNTPAIDTSAHEERAHASGVSFAPFYQFLSTIAHMARMDERQTVLDSVRKAREPGRGESWNAGCDAAMTAIIRVAVERANRQPM